ncbi:hypothetical protein EDC01DRAFT_664109 [Geopyxis carbonaria]|nr:hypothetical protein EDC01DRAFT_664109 [Geopyxis carbonaria]
MKLLAALLFLSPLTHAKDVYDYILIGGGTSSLVLASRLSANPSTTVLILEAGPILDGEAETQLLIPGYIGATGFRYDWNITSVPMASLNNRTTAISTGRIVGGGTAVNGMFFDRASARDYDNWATLTADAGWGWNSLFQCFRKSTTFRAPAPESNITYDASAYGTGPVNAGYPPYILPFTRPLRAALVALGIATPIEGAAGKAVGAFWIPNSIDTRTMTRSYAKNAYYDPVRQRANLRLRTGAVVTRILFRGRTAAGVEYASGPNAPVQKAWARREVILSAGAVHSPRLLQLSGIGDARHLRSVGIKPLVDLPGVGSNLQDHAVLGLVYNSSSPPPMPAAEALALYNKNLTGPYTASSGNFAAFLALDTFSNRTSSLLRAAAADDATYLEADTHPHVAAGWRRQKSLLLATHDSADAAAAEFVTALASLQRPLSRGYVRIASASPWDKPRVDWRSLTHPLDLQILVDAARFVRRYSGAGETWPGAGVQSDADWEKAARERAGPTFAHPSCTTPMGRREEGGVVDSELRVYGVKGLRVVDAGVMPVVPATHLSASVYAVAERAAEVILGRREGGCSV